MSKNKVTVLDVQQAKKEGRKLVMCTAYDYPLKEYKEDVVAVTFPGPEHSFKMPDEALEQLKKLVKS